MWAQVVGNRDEQAVEGYMYEENEDVVLCSNQQPEERLIATKHNECPPLEPTESIHASSFGGQLPSPPAKPFDPGARAV